MMNQPRFFHPARFAPRFAPLSGDSEAALSAAPVRSRLQTIARYTLLMLALAIIMISAVGHPGAQAASVREVNWADLVPAMRNDLQEKAVALDKQLRAMPDDQRETYDKVALEMLLRDEIASGQLKKSSLTERELKVLSENGMKKFPKITSFWREYESLRTAYEEHAEKVRPDLNDVDIRMPGYVLPLEFDGDKVTEFLLVPYVGACIHKPVPAPNQMVFVKAAEPFKSEGLFTPVWVQGRMFAKSGVYNLSLVDGSRDVDSGYLLDAASVTPYKQ